MTALLRIEFAMAHNLHISPIDLGCMEFGEVIDLHKLLGKVLK
jgi:hypothetical protein